jgi:hypothetical protein
MSRAAFPDPAGSAGAANFAGAESLARRRRAEALRARAEGRAPEIADQESAAPESALSERPEARPSAPPERTSSRGGWPRPPSALVAARLVEPPQGARVTVCGLVTVRQRPGSAKGVVFVTLEDETGVINVIVWAKTFARFRREVIAGRLLRVTGRLQREGLVIHVVAETIEDVSHLLDGLARLGRRFDNAWARADEVRRPQPEGSRPPATPPTARAQARLGGPLAAAPPRAVHPREQAKRLFPARPAPEP